MREDRKLYPEMLSNRSDDVDTYIDYRLCIFNDEYRRNMVQKAIWLLKDKNQHKISVAVETIRIEIILK